MTSVVKNNGEIVLRPARPGDGQALYDVTSRSIRELGKQHYSNDQLAGWMGERTTDFYEAMIEKGKAFLAEERGEILGFVDADPGEVTRLFLAPEAAGLGLGARLLKLGVAAAAKDHLGRLCIRSGQRAAAH